MELAVGLAARGHDAPMCCEMVELNQRITPAKRLVSPEDLGSPPLKAVHLPQNTRETKDMTLTMVASRVTCQLAMVSICERKVLHSVMFLCPFNPEHKSASTSAFRN